MMGHREKIKDGAEYDVVSDWRKVMCYLSIPGATNSIKRQMRRRARRQEKQKMKQEIEDYYYSQR